MSELAELWEELQQLPHDEAVRELIAESIPSELTATPAVGIGGARRTKIALAVLKGLHEAGLAIVSKTERP